MTRFVLCCFALLLAFPSVGYGQGYSLFTNQLIDHPIYHPAENRTVSSYKRGFGAWGEDLVEKNLKLRGFDEVFEVKNGKGNGIDRIAIKRRPDGSILDLKVVEVKTSRSSKPKLNVTKTSGVQMSRDWLAEKLKQMRRSGDPNLKKLALEIWRFSKSTGRNYLAVGEVVHLNPATDRMVTYAADGRTVKSEMKITRLLEDIQKRGSTKQIRDSAARDLAKYDQLRAMNQSSYVGKQASKELALESATRNQRMSKTLRNVVATRANTSKQIATILKRSAGRLALFVAFAVDAKELFDIEYAYRNGAISMRERNIRLLSSVGGMAGAMAGASAGAVTGVWIGTLGGPFAWITVPAGGFVGGTVGGVAGYFGGSAAAKMGIESWYANVDASILNKAEIAFLQSGFDQ